jgi:putative aldouronate transport system substrate-binding protein
MKKKVLSLLLSAVLATGILTGCKSNTPAPTVTEPKTNEASSSKGGVLISDKPVELTIFYAVGANGAPNPDMPIWKKAAELTNVKIKNIANPSITDDVQSFQTMLASGNLPDIVQAFRTNFMTTASQGAFAPLNDLIDKHAPNIKQFFNDYKEAKPVCSLADGKIYGVPGTLGGEPGKSLPSEGFFIRQDWLDALGLKVPTTLQQYHDVLLAFRNNDPNKNGKKDEVPLFQRGQSISSYFQLWGAYNLWYVGNDKKVGFGPIEEEYKKAMTNLATWSKEGLIDAEIFTRGNQARQFLLGNNLGGSTIDWFASTAAFNDTFKASVPGLNFVAIAPPADVNGKVKINNSRESLHSYVWGISEMSKNKETAIKFMDFWMSKTGSTLQSYGIEGEHYDVVNGGKVFKEAVLKYPSGMPNFMRSIGSYEIGKRGDIVGEVMAMNEIGQKGFKMYENSTWIQPPFPGLSFNEAEQKTINSNMTNINTYIAEQQQRWLFGQDDIAATWDKYLKNLEAMNVKKVLEAYNSAYQRYLSTLK